MDKDKLISLIKEAWNDGLNSYHDCKYRHEFDTDLENYLDNSEDDINELCESQKPDASENTLPIAGINKQRELLEFFSKQLSPCLEIDVGFNYITEDDIEKCLKNFNGC